jgi:predicted RNase H-like HicB family nuclease
MIVDEGARMEEVMDFTIELDREVDGRWIAEIPQLPGVMCYGGSRNEAVARVKALALRVLADRIEERAGRSSSMKLTFATATA